MPMRRKTPARPQLKPSGEGWWLQRRLYTSLRAVVDEHTICGHLDFCSIQRGSRKVVVVDQAIRTGGSASVHVQVRCFVLGHKLAPDDFPLVEVSRISGCRIVVNVVSC